MFHITNRDISLECLTQFGGDELQEVLKEAGITNAVHRYWLEYGKRCFWRENYISYLSVSDGHRYQVLTIISLSSKFLRHRILEALDGLQDDLLSDSGLQVGLQSTAIRFFGISRKPHNRVKSPRVTWAALKLNMMFIWLTHMDRWQCLLTSITGGILQFL